MPTPLGSKPSSSVDPDSRPETPRSAMSAPPPGAVGIPVRVLRFRQPIDIPGADVVTSCNSNGKSNQRRWEIEYQPWMRHHKVTYRDPARESAEVGYVHESAVSCWIPV